MLRSLMGRTHLVLSGVAMLLLPEEEEALAVGGRQAGDFIYVLGHVVLGGIGQEGIRFPVSRLHLVPHGRAGHTAGIDGFGLVEELRLDPRTRNIPIVVVSAKDITPEERERLNGHIEALYQKASLPPRKFVDQLIQVIEDKSGS
jgi:CheY-like chemotaxis protein